MNYRKVNPLSWSVGGDGWLYPSESPQRGPSLREKPWGGQGSRARCPCTLAATVPTDGQTEGTLFHSWGGHDIPPDLPQGTKADILPPA